MTEIVWTYDDMIDAACEWWGEGFDPADCEVREWPYNDDTCLVVLHTPTGRTSNEAGRGGCWNLNGTAR